MQQRKRLEWIHKSLTFMGSFDRAAFEKKFMVSQGQISQDLRQFVRWMYSEGRFFYVRRGALIECDSLEGIPRGQVVDGIDEFDPSAAGYPSLDVGSPTEWLLENPPDFLATPDVALRVEPDTDLLRKIVNAIEQRTVIEADYVSMTSGLTTRYLSCHAMVHIAGRFHVRAFDHDLSEFRDFVLTRFERVSSHKKLSYVCGSEDHDWLEPADMTIAPAARIDTNQQKAVAREFGMTGVAPRRVIRSTKAFLFYIRAALHIHEKEWEPPITENNSDEC